MKLLLVREHDNGDDTVGKMFWKNGKGEVKYVHTLEDEYREAKKRDETRIPEGFYDIGIRREGKHYDKYYDSKNDQVRSFTRKYGSLHVMGVPNFTWIMIHTGNVDEHTSGCILVGSTSNNNSKEEGFIGGSMVAYAFLLEGIEEVLNKGEKITLEVRDFDREIERSL